MEERKKGGERDTERETDRQTEKQRKKERKILKLLQDVEQSIQFWLLELSSCAGCVTNFLVTVTK